MHRLESFRCQIEHQILEVCTFKECDLYGLGQWREFFWVAFGKLKQWTDVLLRIVKHINDYTYKIDFPSDYNIFVTFNIADLSPYYEDAEALVDERVVSPTSEEWHDRVSSEYGLALPVLMPLAGPSPFGCWFNFPLV